MAIKYKQTRHSTSIEVTMVNSVGVLGRICTLIGEQGANISDKKFVTRNLTFIKQCLN